MQLRYGALETANKNLAIKNNVFVLFHGSYFFQQAICRFLYPIGLETLKLLMSRTPPPPPPLPYSVHLSTVSSPISPGAPATPFITKLSDVRVPVLSKQQTSTLPARGIRKGSVQKIRDCVRAVRELMTARLSSMGNSGGMTLVRIMMQCSTSLKGLRVSSARPCATVHGNSGGNPKTVYEGKGVAGEGEEGGEGTPLTSS